MLLSSNIEAPNFVGAFCFSMKSCIEDKMWVDSLLMCRRNYICSGMFIYF